jgi:uncharacterized protein (TIGR03435 family)
VGTPDRPVVDRTGITGLYNFQLEFGMTENTPQLDPYGDLAFGAAAEAPGGALDFAVLQRQNGLKLGPAKGPREFLAIDHIQRPSAN